MALVGRLFAILSMGDGALGVIAPARLALTQELKAVFAPAQLQPAAELHVLAQPLRAAAAIV